MSDNTHVWLCWVPWLSVEADVTVMVENGQVIGIYSNNDLIAADVIDLDVQDEEVFEQLKISADKAWISQHSVW